MKEDHHEEKDVGGKKREGVFDEEEEAMTPKLFISLMQQFYQLGWMHGSGGGMVVSAGSLTYYSPSSVQKERLKEDDLFVFNSASNTLLRRPRNPAIKESACTPVFNLILKETHTGCVIHSHSHHSNLLTQLLWGRNHFEINDQEMIKGIVNRRTGANHTNNDRLVVPIVENAPEEHMLNHAIKAALVLNPSTSAVLVRCHGVFVFGRTWQKTKIMAECYEYLFKLGCAMLRSNNVPLIKSRVERAGSPMPMLKPPS